jgi:hypothetical protein
METKVCKKCHIQKSLDDFGNHKKYKDGKNSECKMCFKETRKKYYGRYKERVNKWYNENSELTKLRSKEWKTSNPERNKELNQKSDKRRRQKITQKNKQLYHSNDLIRLRYQIHSLIGNSFRKKGYSKKSITQNILGIDFLEFKNHLQSQFTDGMNWENKNEWEIDHIIPISIAKNEEQIIKLNHHLNLRPLWAKDNRKKSNKILEEHKELLYKLLGDDFVLMELNGRGNGLLIITS